MASYFITGIGTDVGKTIVAGILAEALQADYWKPIQAGYEKGSDSERVKTLLSNNKSKIHPETYLLKLAASPHISAKAEDVEISINKIIDELPVTSNHLFIEGAGGVMVPLNKNNFVLDLIKKLNCQVIIVSKNYLGSINHSLLTAEILKQNKIDIAGWIFNDEYLNYESDIIEWTNIKKIASIMHLPVIDKSSVFVQAAMIKDQLKDIL